MKGKIILILLVVAIAIIAVIIKATKKVSKKKSDTTRGVNLVNTTQSVTSQYENPVAKASSIEEYPIGNQKKYCIRCGKQMPISASFCPSCGASQEENDEEEPVYRDITFKRIESIVAGAITFELYVDDTFVTYLQNSQWFELQDMDEGEHFFYLVASGHVTEKARNKAREIGRNAAVTIPAGRNNITFEIIPSMKQPGFSARIM